MDPWSFGKKIDSRLRPEVVQIGWRLEASSIDVWKGLGGATAANRDGNLDFCEAATEIEGVMLLAVLVTGPRQKKLKKHGVAKQLCDRVSSLSSLDFVLFSCS